MAVYRATKQEHEQALVIIKKIWRVAYEKGGFKLKFPKTPRGRTQRDRTYSAIAEHRQSNNRKKLEVYGDWKVTSAVTLQRKGKYEIILTRKPEALESRAETIINFAEDYPELATEVGIGIPGVLPFGLT